MTHPILTCRRSLIAILAMGCLTALGYINPTATSACAQAIAMVAIGLAGSNAYQGSIEAKIKQGVQDAKG